MVTELINLTSHDVVLYVGEVETARWAPSGAIARVNEDVEVAPSLMTDLGAVPTRLVAYRDGFPGLPERTENTAYLVSRVFAATHPRSDLYFPFDEVRQDGAVVGCRALGQFVRAEESMNA